jgi:serine phosphatase RsbU (regulator of sigma subunit)/anti-sigma regulatory factor (Ser/Thr protein kinase)
VEVSTLTLDSPALYAAKARGIQLLVPLISQGELVGVLQLGEQMSERNYSREDRTLLNTIASQAAPALVVGELVREREEQARKRERDEQEMRIAHQIQLALLPKDLPQVRGWRITPLYQPARAVGGDFYDFIDLPDGKLGILIGDVSSKGVPAALVMATTRSILRGAARRQVRPSLVLQRANEILAQEMPRGMFVTCLYVVIDTLTGEVALANAGHDLPIHRSIDASGQTIGTELLARGMPLGLMPNMQYEEAQAVLCPGDTLVMYSDGLVEAHNPAGEMFGFGRVTEQVQRAPQPGDMNSHLVRELHAFTGEEWEQEDDITLVTLTWVESVAPPVRTPIEAALDAMKPAQTTGEARDELELMLLDTYIPSAEGNEQLAVLRVIDAVQPLALPQNLIERIRTAVAEAAMNAIEHGNQYDPNVAARVRVSRARSSLYIRLTDSGSAPLREPPAPNLDAKLAGLQSPRGWGIFLIRNMTDEMRDIQEEGRHTLELTFQLPVQE